MLSPIPDLHLSSSWSWKQNTFRATDPGVEQMQCAKAQGRKLVVLGVTSIKIPMF